MQLDVIFAPAVVVLAGLAVLGALALVIVWEWCAIRLTPAGLPAPANPPGAGARRPGVGAACAAAMRITGRWLLVSWLVPALVMLGLDGRLTAFLAWATSSTLLALGVGALARQQRAPSFLDRPPLPYRYRVADDLGQPIAAVITAAEYEATLTSGLTAPGSAMNFGSISAR
jgi:hypothetical protein